MTTPDSYGTIGETWADSLLFGRNFSAKLANGANAEAIGDNVFVNAVDNNTQTVAAFNAGVGTTVTYDLHGTASIDKFYMIAKGNYVIKTYELYVSDKLDTLYNGENYLLTGGNNTSSGAIHNCFTFTGENKPEGRYIGVKILELGHPANYPDYASICETAIFGIKTIKTTNEELISAKTKILNADYTTDEKTYFDFNEDSEMDVCDLVLMNKALGN